MLIYSLLCKGFTETRITDNGKNKLKYDMNIALKRQMPLVKLLKIIKPKIDKNLK